MKIHPMTALKWGTILGKRAFVIGYRLVELTSYYLILITHPRTYYRYLWRRPNWMVSGSLSINRSFYSKLVHLEKRWDRY